MIRPTSWEYFAKAPTLPISKERIKKRSSFFNPAYGMEIQVAC
jgi:hypothetical protein